MERKHAYLIMAHHEFELLQQLVSALDDKRNDIFVHIDKKVSVLPILKTEHADLYILEDRIDIRWGHVSQILGEYTLWRYAYDVSPSYSYFHLISGTHLPLYPQDYIHKFFDRLGGEQVLVPLKTNEFQTDQKMNRYNFFMRTFADKNKMISRLSQVCWRILLGLQRTFNIRRNLDQNYQYASNWLSLTADAVAYLLSVRDVVLGKYKYTLCGDEYFVPTVLANAPYSYTVVREPLLLKQEIGDANAHVYSANDLQMLLESGCLFARKFSERDMDVVYRIIEIIKNRK